MQKRKNNIRSKALKIAWFVTALAAIVLLVVYYGRLEKLYKHDRTTGTALAATDISPMEKIPGNEGQAMAEITTPESAGSAAVKPSDTAPGQDSEAVIEETVDTGENADAESTSNTAGTEGADGSSGTEGTDGSSGTEGADGSSDTEGTEGADGSSDTAGIEGTEGTAGTQDTPEDMQKPEVDLSDDPDSEGSLVAGDEEGIDPYKPMIAFSFDDGPSKYTERILSALAEYGARATFFMVGYNVENKADIVKMVYDAGCEIANHTSDHKNLAKSKKSAVVSQVEDNQALIESIVPVGGLLVRPPYGSYNDTTKSLVKHPMICWSVDSLDWKTRNADSIEKQIFNDVRDGYIVLMHDLYETTAEAVERVIPKLIEEGYQIVTVSELFAARGETLEAGHVYRKTITAEELMEKEAAEKAQKETE